MILRDIGEIGIHCGPNVYLLRPSLYAMSRLGSSELIVSILTLTFDESADLIRKFLPEEISKTMSFRAAHDVLRNCWTSDPSDSPVVLGEYSEDEFVAGLVPIEHVIPLARCLLKHGLIGDLEQSDLPKKKEEKYTPKFVARDHVAFAMAHLGLSERDAWDLTMTSFLLAIKAKYPPSPESDLEKPSSEMSAEKHDETMEWLDKINAKRAKRGKKRG